MNSDGFVLPPGAFAVVNPGGRDPEQVFPEGAGRPGPEHPPVNFHAYAACVHGGFFAREERVPPGCRHALVLLRKKLSPARRAIERLRSRGIACHVTLKEAGWHQACETLLSPSWWREFREVVEMADGALLPTPDLVPVFRAAGAKRAEFVPTPYPLESEQWNFACPEEKRAGIFLGTREFDVPSRRHPLALRLALAAAKEAGTSVTMLDDGSCPGSLRRDFAASGQLLRMVRAPLPYADYLRLMAAHEVVFQMDASRVPGQVAGDACLARVLCIGGDGAVERVAFSGTCGAGRSDAEAGEMLRDVLHDRGLRRRLEEEAARRAALLLGFGPIARRLAEYLTP